MTGTISGASRACATARLVVVVGMLGLTFASCGGGSSNPIQGVSPGGIWRGMDSASGLSVVGLMDETGSGDFIRSDNALYTAQVSTSGNSISVTGDIYPSFAANRFPDGSLHGTWTMTGTIQERQSITATTEFITDAGTVTNGTLDLTFDSLYDRPSSVATVAGTYDDGKNSAPFTIGSDGSWQISVLICHGQGQISVIDPAHNLYRVQETVTCDNTGTVTSNGLATLDNTLTPEALVVGYAGGGSAVSGTWPRMN